MVKNSPPNPNETVSSGEVNFTSWTQRPWLKTEPLLRVLLVLLIIIASIWLATLVWQVVSFFSSLILLFSAAWLVALLLTGPVRWFIQRGWPKMVAIAMVYALLVGIMAGFVTLVLPGLIAQTQLLSNNLGGLTGELERNIYSTLKNLGVTNVNLDQASNQLQSIGTDLLKNALGLATGIANFIIQLLLLCIISVSLLSSRHYTEKARGLVQSGSPSLWQRLPERYRRRVNFIRLSFERNFGVFLGGQLVVAFIYGLITWIIMWVAGFDYPVTTGCICGALMIIPFFGGPLSLLPPLIVAFSRNDSPIIIVLILLFVIQTALLNVVLPKLVGKSSGVGPVLTLFVLLAGAQIGGVFGVLLAVPITGVAKSLSVTLLNEFLKRDETQATTVAVTAPASSTVELNLNALVGRESKSN